MDAKLMQAVLETITPERCTELAVQLVDIPSLTGNEQPIAECVHRILGEVGAESYMQEFEPARYNTIGRLRGRGDGATLLFNGHMDIAFNGTEPYLPRGRGYQPRAVVENGWIYGMGVHNMKSGCAAFLAAAEAIRKSGVELRGDLLMAFVGGEIERHSVLQFQGPSFRGGGCGTKHFVTNGGIADMAVVGEPTSLMLINEHVGSVAVRITTRGQPAPLRVADHGTNAIKKMQVLIDEFEPYAQEYSERNPYKDRQATVHMHSIEGGWPFRCNRVPIFCHVFLEYRLMPNQKFADVPLDVEALLARVKKKRPDIAFETEFFVTLPPARDCSKTAIADATRRAHTTVTNTAPQEGVGLFCSDASHLQAYGIPAINYGPSGRTVSGVENWDPDIGEHTSIEDLTATAKVYAAIALDVLGKTREELSLKRGI
jgi:acetylornithine deacetylase/succinyl-diaminopimelate desuccinylase-like protein